MELDFSSIRKKVHSPEEGEQLGLPLDFSTIRQDPAPGILPSQSSIGDHHPQLSQLSQLSQPPQEVSQPPQELIRDFIPALKYGENTLQLNKAIGDLSQRQYVEENPLEAGLETLLTVLTSGLPKQAKTDEELAALEQEVAERRAVQEGQRIIGTKDVGGFGDAVDLVLANIGASAPAMGRSIASLGTMTPDIMSNEINANLAEMENLSSKDRMALSKGGGLFAAALENIGLGFMIKGIPPSVFAKMGFNKAADLIEKSVIAKSLSRGGVASITEGITEGGQEATGVAAELIAGKEFVPGEIAERIEEAVKLGAITGGALATGGSATVGGIKKVGKKEIQPEQTGLDFSTIRGKEPKFDKTIDKRKKLQLEEEPKLDVKEDDGIFTDDEGQKWQKLEVDEDVDLQEETITSTTEADAVEFFDDTPKKKPFKIAPKVFEDEKGGDPQVEEEVKSVDTAVPDESSESQSTPVSTEAASPTQTGQPNTEVLPPKEKDTTEQAGTEEDTSVDADVKEEVETEKEVDIYDDNTRMPVESLYTKRYADRIEYLKEEYPDGMNWYDYREDLQEIKQEQLDDRGSDKDVDDFADELDTRAVTNFTKAVKKGAKQPTPTQEELAQRIEDETEDIDPDDELGERLYSEGATPTGLSTDEVKAEIEGSFGKGTIRKLTKNDGVIILATQKELEAELNATPSKQGRQISGAFIPSSGKVYLVAENISKDKAAGVLLHEVGEHAALNDMLGDTQYEALSKNFDELVKAEDPIALAAQKRIPKQTLPSKLKGEQLAYLVQEVQNELSKGGKVTSKARTLYNRIINLIRKWMTKLPSYRKFEGRAALKRLQKGELLTPNNIASLARVAVDYHTATEKKSFKKDMVQFSEDGGRVTTTEEASAWKEDNKRPERKRARVDSPELQQAAEDLEAGEITFEEYQEKVDQIAPIKKFDKVPEPATNLEVAGAIDEGKLKKGKLLNEDGVIEDGDIVENRLDIPAYEDYDTWVATITPKEGGKIYGGTAKLKDVTFKTQPSGSLKIAQGKGKYPLATMKGEWVNSTNEDLKTEADDLMNDPDWVQVGMNPERQSSFYAKEDKTINGEVIKKGTPLASAEEVIQVGAFVLAKKPTTKEAPKFKSKKTGEEIQFSEPEVETTQKTAKQKRDEIVEARFEKAKVKAKKKSPFTSIKEVAVRAKNSFTRSHVDLDPKKYGQTLEYLRNVKDVAQYSQWQTFQDIYEFVDKLNDKELEIFTYNIILPDMVKDLDSGLLSKKDGELPFGFESKQHVKDFLKDKKKLAEGKVAKAVDKRNKVMQKLKEELIDEGLLPEEIRNDKAYYHHQVIQYMEVEDKGDFSVMDQKQAGVRTKKQGWQKARTGSTKDYNTQYLDAEFAVMSMMRSQLETKRLLNKIKKEEDKSKQIKAQAKKEDTTVEDLLKNSEEWQGFTVWKPNPDSVWFHTYTLNDKVVQEVMAEVERTDKKIAENKKALKEGKRLPRRTQDDRTKAVEVTEEDIGSAIVKGKDETWIIPKELAKTLNERKPTKEWYDKASAVLLQTWKKWVLLNPERSIKYNINNSSGDIDIATAFDLKIMAGTKKAAKDLYNDHKKKKLGESLKEEFADSRKRGVIDSGFAITEVDDFSRMYDKMFNARPSNMKDETWAEATVAVAKDIKDAPVKLAKGYWNTVKDYTTMRENVLRLATYRYFKKRIAKNPNEKIYAASKSYEIDQIRESQKESDVRDKEGLTETDRQIAAKLTRELIGDYGNISHAGQFIREHLMPFWSWTEINSPRYIRLLANSAKETSGDQKAIAKRLAKVAGGKAVRTGGKWVYSAAKFSAFMGLVSLWNWTFFSEEEEKLSEFERGQLHLILGDIFGNGEVVTIRASGAFSDALSWLSLHDTFSDYQQGKTIGEQWEEIWKAPIQKIASGLTPFPKLFYETIAGKSFWPDVFNPRPTRDRWQHIAKAFSVGKIYDWAFDKPSRGWGKNLSKLLVNSTDPGESAYYKVRQMVREFNEKKGQPSYGGGGSPSDKSNALYYYKQALRYQDFEIAEKYLNDYKRLGGTPKGLKTSIKRISPVAGIKKKEIKEFKSTLSDADKKTIKVALQWYKEVYKRK